MPIIGWMWYFTEMVFCTRKWEQDRKTMSQSLLHLRDYPEKYFVRTPGRPACTPQPCPPEQLAHPRLPRRLPTLCTLPRPSST